MVKILLPPISGQNKLKPLFHTLKKGELLYRIFCPSPEVKLTALTFRHLGPMNRFDHQRCNIHDDCYAARTCEPSYDSERGISYFAPTISSCLVEVFGDMDIIQITNHRIGLITPKCDLNLLDIRNQGAMRAGANEATLSKIPDRGVSQSWSRYFYEQPKIYTHIHGIIYGNAHNDEDAIAMYERAEQFLTLKEELSLKHKELRRAILKAAADNNLIIEPYEELGVRS
jgi:RES domain